jgi:hypothetical protein
MGWSGNPPVESDRRIVRRTSSRPRCVRRLFRLPQRTAHDVELACGGREDGNVHRIDRSAAARLIRRALAEPRSDLEREEPAELLGPGLELSCAKGALNLGLVGVGGVIPHRLLQQTREIEAAKDAVQKCAFRVPSTCSDPRELIDGLCREDAERCGVVRLQRRQQFLQELRRRSGSRR